MAQMVGFSSQYADFILPILVSMRAGNIALFEKRPFCAPYQEEGSERER
jgi:hypothetical protein